ncbi:MAG TPA: DUF4389 domain-containing protein [Acidimicrobiales bacterium]|nr:DUF4389 domain-containing protein [Acidimicrobiales bacterium]
MSSVAAATAATDHPVQLSIGRAEHYSRGLAVLGCLFFYGRMIALIPVYLVLMVIGIVSFLVGWIMQFAVLFTGKYPDGAHEFLTGYLRLSVRMQSWLFGLTDRYPGFSLKP